MKPKLQISPLLKKYLKTSAIAAGVFLLLGIVLFVALRNLALERAIKQVNLKLYKGYQLHLHTKKAVFSGLWAIEISNLQITENNTDTIISIKYLKVIPDWWDLLWGEKNVNEIAVSGMVINLKLQNKKETESTHTDTLKRSNTLEKELAPLLSKLLSRAFDAIPEEILVDSSQIHLHTTDFSESITLQKLSLIKHQLHGVMQYDMNGVHQQCNISGRLYAGQREALLTISSADSSRIVLPYITKAFQTTLAFTNANMHIGDIVMRKNQLRLHCDMQLQNLLLNQPKVSSKDVLLPSIDVQLNMRLAKGIFEMDSSSYIRLDSLKVHTYFAAQTNETDTILQLKLIIPQTQSNHFIDALPDGLFNHIRGMDVAGAFDFRLDFHYSENQPESTRFDTHLNKYNFAIRRYGQANIDKLNQSFTHTVVERGRAIRSFTVGESNPYYTPLSVIPEKLIKCVLICEDPSFFYHRGFIDEAFRQSIVKNIRTRRFARGASTISMQLVKNAFLTREKTLSRKLEEILLVYIIENNRLVSKDRMMEVYLNIIEWGPGVYGIGEAAHFYFNKKPHQLTLSECLFLATIIPRPKGFMWRFDSDGQPRDFTIKQYQYLTNLMLKRGFIAEHDTVGINYYTPISGSAKQFLVKQPAQAPAIRFDENGLPIYNNDDDEDEN